VARNRKRAKERRPRQPGTPVDPSQGLPTATHDADNGAAEHEHDNGAAELGRAADAPGLEPVDLESSAVEDELEAGSYEDEELESAVHDDREDGAPPPLEHAMPDGELAEQQLEVGRPDEPEPEEGEDEEEFEREVAAAVVVAVATMGEATPAHPVAASWPPRARRPSRSGTRAWFRGSSASSKEAGVSCNEYSGPTAVRCSRPRGS
jgi:hypothetical protein